LQRTIWGYSDIDVESRALLVVASHFAGQVIGAFAEERLIGFALAFWTNRNGEVRLHSHRVGVLPEYQNLGVGRTLKLAQREDAIARGIKVIQWTFDPLQVRNAFFNFEKLGGTAREYLSNLYGITSSPLHGGLPTDRLLIEWEIESPRVRRILDGDRPPFSDQIERIAAPNSANCNDAAFQRQLKDQFLQLLGSGYAVTGLEKIAERSYYVMEKQ
jgi:predicted GNAT superfamily acetyltransferase